MKTSKKQQLLFKLPKPTTNPQRVKRCNRRIYSDNACCDRRQCSVKFNTTIGGRRYVIQFGTRDIDGKEYWHKGWWCSAACFNSSQGLGGPA